MVVLRAHATERECLAAIFTSTHTFNLKPNLAWLPAYLTNTALAERLHQRDAHFRGLIHPDSVPVASDVQSGAGQGKCGSSRRATLKFQASGLGSLLFIACNAGGADAVQSR